MCVVGLNGTSYDEQSIEIRDVRLFSANVLSAPSVVARTLNALLRPYTIDVGMELSTEDFEQLLNGELDLCSALTGGRVSLRGDQMRLLDLGLLFETVLAARRAA